MKALIVTTTKKEKRVYKSVEQACIDNDLSPDTVQNYLTRRKSAYVSDKVTIDRVKVEDSKVTKILKLEDGTCVKWDGEEFEVIR